MKIVDSAESTARAVVEMNDKSEDGERNLSFFVTDSVEKFRRLGARFLGQPIEQVEHVDLRNDREKAGQRKRPRFLAAFEGSCDLSVQAESDFYVDLHGHRPAIFHSRLEGPAPHGFNSLLIQTQSKGARDLDIARFAVRAYDQPQNAGSLILRFAASSEYSGSGSKLAGVLKWPPLPRHASCPSSLHAPEHDNSLRGS